MVEERREELMSGSEGAVHFREALIERQREQGQHITELNTRVAAVQQSQAQLEAKISGDLGEMKALIQSALRNQDTVSTRLNRPVGPLIIGGVTAILGTISILATFIALTVNPIKDNIEQIEEARLLEAERNLRIHMMLEQDAEDNQISNAVQSEALEWMKEFEQRNYVQIQELEKSYNQHVIECLKEKTRCASSD